MQLLLAPGVSAAQFVSLSLLLKPTATSNNNVANTSWIDMVEPMMVVSPTAVVSRIQSMESLKELHSFLSDVLKSGVSSRTGTSVAADFLREDEKSFTDCVLQVFRPLRSAGIGLYYKLLKPGNDNSNLTKFYSMLISSSRNSSSLTKHDPISSLYGVVICVGSTGAPYCHRSSSVHYTIAQRINDVLMFLASSKVTDTISAKALLHTFLLSDDEFRKTNDMINAPNLLIVPEPNDSDVGGARNLLSPMGIISPIADIGRKTKRASMQVIRGGSGATNEAGGVPPELGFILSLDHKAADAARLLTERLRVLSVSETDSKLRKYEISGSDRKANLDLTGGAKSRFRRARKGEKEADFDNFDYKGPMKDFVKKVSNPDAPALAVAPEVSNKLTLKSSKKDTTTKRSTVTASRRSITQTGARLIDDESSQQASLAVNFGVGNSFDPFVDNLATTGKISKRQFDDEQSHLSDHRDTSSAASQQTRIAVNLALNEDLTCSYKMSQLISCSVEGFLQVSVKSNMRPGSVPFALSIRDPANQIETISENKKIVQDISHTVALKEGNELVRNKYVINVPKFDTYFAIMKYQCVGDLRPVPIRVQTKVKADGAICRVALQISSNPNNGASLTDLTIVMGVPQKVRGQSLVTQPPGGVWDEAKSSVIWCVSELGSGEKFQLQARFEMMKSDGHSSELQFPVLVRCQCLFAQLSAVEVETQEIPDTMPLEIVTKVAKRYRLSHREKNN